MIIVEGFDGSGKSTLAGKIGQELGWPVLHPGGPTRSEQEVYDCLIRSLTRMRTKCVQDRVTHVSEAVYSMLAYPMKSAIALNSLREIAVCELVIYCRPPTELLLESFRNHRVKEHDDFMELEKVMRDAPTLIRLYDTMMHLVSFYVGARLIKYDRFADGSESHVLDICRRKFK